MKVLLVNKFHYEKSGSEKVYFFTKKILEDNGHEVICFSMKDDKNLPCPQSDFFVDNIDFTKHDDYLAKSVHYLYSQEAREKMEQLIIQEKPDIAHLHNISHQLTASILRPLKEYGIPVVQTLHDYQLICPNYRLYTQGRVCERCKKHKYFQCVMHKCAQDSYSASVLAALELTLQWIGRTYREKVDLFLSPSEFLKEKLIAWGVKQKIKVLRNALPLEKYEPQYEAGDYLLVVSRLSKEKGIMTLIRAIRKVPTLRLKIVGFGPDKKRIQEYIKKKQVHNVEILGAKYGEELEEIIKNCSFVVIPSEWYENAPIAAIEAMAYGKPVMASNLGGLNELIAENYNGWHFEAKDIKGLRLKLKQISINTYQIEQFGRNARQTVEKKNSGEAYYVELMKHYNSILPSDKQLKLG